VTQEILKPIETIAPTIVVHTVVALFGSVTAVAVLSWIFGLKALLGLIPLLILIWLALYRSATQKVVVEEFHTMLAMLLSNPSPDVVLGPGDHWLPYPPILSASSRPVPQTKFVHTDVSHRKEIIDFGHFTSAEAQGQVFMGERLFKAIVSVLSKDGIEVLVDANYVIRVTNPYDWKRSDNPWGTLMNRFEASLRIILGKFNALDANAIQSVIPHLLRGGTVYLAVCNKKVGDYDVGDVVRNKFTKEPIVVKVMPHDPAEVAREATDGERQDSIQTLLGHLRNADEALKPTDGFTEAHVITLRLDPKTEGLHLEEARLGAVGVTVAVQDITLPVSISEAAAKAKATMKERVTAITAAETAKLATEKMPDVTTEAGRIRAEMNMAERGKSTYVIGRGDNLIAQLGAILKGTK